MYKEKGITPSYIGQTPEVAGLLRLSRYRLQTTPKNFCAQSFVDQAEKYADADSPR